MRTQESVFPGPKHDRCYFSLLTPIPSLPAHHPGFCHSEHWASSVDTEAKSLSKDFSLSAFDFSSGILMAINKLHPSYIYSSEGI